MNNDNVAATRFDREATAAVASIATILDPHVADGANPSILAFAALAYGANLLAQTTSPGDAAMTLTAIAAGLAPRHGMN